MPDPDPWVLRVLREGYQIPFLNSPPALSSQPIALTAYHPGSEKYRVLVDEVQSMLEKDAIEAVDDGFLGFYNRLFAVQKANGGWRPVLDVSVLNKFVSLTKFKMESPRSVLQSVRLGDWMVSIDLQDAYFHVPIHPGSRKFLRFVFAGQVYQFKALCFGLSTAPQVFTRVFAQVAKWLHLQGVRVVFYLDDWLVLDQSFARILEATCIIFQFSKVLGFVVNHKKSCLVPSQVAVYLGMVINTRTFVVSPKEKRISNFLSLLGEFLSSSRPPARSWQVLLGH
ncbi:MAG: reverse transcriptase domain-containing protein, partial [Cyanobacteria bacterium J06553_1]